jgi:type VI secretion system secreted protein VgrG
MLDTGMAQVVGSLDEGIAELLEKEKKVTQIAFSYGEDKKSFSSISRHYTDINLHAETKGYNAGESVSIKVDMPDGSTESFSGTVGGDGKVDMMNVFSNAKIELEEI